MRKQTPIEILSFNLQHPKIKYTVYGCYNANVLVFEGDIKLCQWYKKTYNKNLTIKGIK